MKLHLKEERPLLYFSGVGSSGMGEDAFIKNGAKYRCFSYAYTSPDGFYYSKKIAESLKIAEKKGMGVMMDSAAHSFHKLKVLGLRKKSGKWSVKDTDKLRDKVVETYAQYVLKEGKKWDFVVNFDYVRDCPVIYAMQKQLEKLGIRPVPVYHGDQPDEWLKRYCEEGHKLICLGSVKRSNKYMRYYYDRCFNIAAKYGVLLHGLAVTSLSLMYGYEWYSVDSATWAKVAAFGCILSTSAGVNDTFGYIHLSDRRHGQGRGIEYLDLPKNKQREINHEIEDNGFDPKQLLTDGAARSMYNVYIFCNRIQHLKEVVRSGKTRWQSLAV
jgi:hypothetical protein